MPAETKLRPADVEHRTGFADYARHHGHAPFTPVIARLYELWDGWNRDYFEGQMVRPHITLL